MDIERVNAFILTNAECFSSEDLGLVRMKMEAVSDDKWDMLATADIRNPQTALMLSIFGGPIGIDRIYIGQVALGMVKTFTLGGALVWAFVDQFLIRKATRDSNMHKVMDILNL